MCCGGIRSDSLKGNFLKVYFNRVLKYFYIDNRGGWLLDILYRYGIIEDRARYFGKKYTYYWKGPHVALSIDMSIDTSVSKKLRICVILDYIHCRTIQKRLCDRPKQKLAVGNCKKRTCQPVFLWVLLNLSADVFKNGSKFAVSCLVSRNIATHFFNAFQFDYEGSF